MKQLSILVLILFSTIGCKKNEIPSASLNLKNCQIEYLFFKDDIQFSDFETLSYFPGDSFHDCSYTYDPVQMTRITGGFFPRPQGTNLSSYIFTDYAYDSITMVDKTFSVYSKFIDSEGITNEYYTNPMVFILDSQNQILKIETKKTVNPGGDVLDYRYSDNLITETANDSILRRKFYFENNNLVKVITEWYSPPGILNGKKEIIFQDFDDKPNPFKNKYYVKGAFFRAFSDHNYQSYTVNSYGKLSDSTLYIYKTYSVSMPLNYNANGYPKFGDYE